jgi:formate dehydrogenase subunit gamma
VVEHEHWTLEGARPLIERWATVQGGLLPMLIEIQERFGYIDDEAVPSIAEALNISRAEVVGVVGFYHDFKHEPPAKHTLKICLAEACQAMGSDALAQALRTSLGAGPGERSSDGAVAVDPVYCLGNCGLSPAIMLNGRVYGRVTAERAERLLAAAP